ncbi:hypothetical protein KFL_004940010 [Klebsormidium nitens]|uniref:Uncharacterized protein n=1 Tax=Klebsormidium nitens TaxID=105231 RepID=A0A1Y1IGI9_KLENI|nr:hypothetical protein KFL_004940010 [Klebsormidium nitens]|eukprot:GAQ89172.1 hypothetical protein KFL_004940010 [Klebsormidium nitens]
MLRSRLEYLADETGLLNGQEMAIKFVEALPEKLRVRVEPIVYAMGANGVYTLNQAFEVADRLDLATAYADGRRGKTKEDNDSYGRRPWGGASHGPRGDLHVTGGRKQERASWQGAKTRLVAEHLDEIEQSRQEACCRSAAEDTHRRAEEAREIERRNEQRRELERVEKERQEEQRRKKKRQEEQQQREENNGRHGEDQKQMRRREALEA